MIRFVSLIVTTKKSADGAQYLSPGQRPGLSVTYLLLALKGRDKFGVMPIDLKKVEIL